MSEKIDNQDKKAPLKIPSVLAFEKKIIPSDGFMYSLKWENKDHDLGKSTEANNNQVISRPSPLPIVEKSIRGTISNRLVKKGTKDSIKIDAEVTNANLQIVDHCALNENDDTLKLKFTLKILGGLENIALCNDQAFRISYQQQIKTYLENSKCEELALRYATNIANGRFLWRNRVGVEAIEVIVKDLNDEEYYLEFNAQEFTLNNFTKENENIKTLAYKIAKTLTSKNDYLLLEITSYVKIGKAQTVYPSEELVLENKKQENKKSKVLYQVNGVAAMHSQKIGNAIRTIDTWYPTDEKNQDIGPIAIETYGAVTTHGVAYRKPSTKKDFYSLFDKWSIGKVNNITEEIHYIVAVLIRGGVFGESEKKEKNDNENNE